MPAIRKIRIVNFRYNDGAKLIPDEIFCTENSEGKPIDTLLNLDNGGGKSVIVQLLLQPICPKAKVQNRNISDYFQKGTDHAFVLIEWALDGSSNSLLTGIAMASSTTADDDNESKNIRFYTFMHDYSRTGDKLDLINMPLSEKNGSHTNFSSFEEVRKFLQNRKVEYFPSDALNRYHKRLEEYGILYTEWENIIARVNSVEGGITKFFDEYKTADRLLDKFIIPGVMPNDKESAEVLEEMFRNYSDSYAGQEENLRLQSQITVFNEKLRAILPFMKNMWDAEDTRLQSIHLLADYLFTLEYHIKNNTEKHIQLEETISALKEKLHHIRAEKASETVYLAQERFDTAEIQLAEYSRKKDDSAIQRDKYTHMVSVLNAAKEYAELTEQQNEEKALSAQLRELDNGTQDSRILSLMYSLLLAADNLKQQTEQELSLENETRNSHADTYNNTQNEISSLVAQQSEENNILNKSIGFRDSLLKQINDGLKLLSLNITVMLDGRYSTEDIENINSSYDNQIRVANAEIERCQNEENELRQELDRQDDRRAELIQSQADCKVRLKQQESALEQYKKSYDSVVRVLEHLSLPVSQIFTDEPMLYLNQIIAGLNEQLKQAERSAELLTEQVRCIETGQLHISKTAISFLQESGISYQTGEQYLNFQSPKIREDILSVNPLVAYSVVVDSEKEQTKLLSQSSDTWLSAVVPIYTRSEIADMTDGNYNENNRFLSAFDREYFNDVPAYAENIRHKLENSKSETEHFHNQINEWQSEREILSGFTYSVDDEKQIQTEIISCQNELNNIQNQLSSLDSRKTEIRKRTAEILELKNKYQNNMRNTENSKNEFLRICEIISQYEERNNQIIETESKCRQLSRQIEKLRKEEKHLSEIIQECDIKIGQYRDKITEYKNLLDELKETPETDLISEDYSSMLAEYRLYQENYSADRQRLQEQLRRIREIIRKKANAIQRFHIEPNEYENTSYSEDAYRHAEEQLNQSVHEYEKILGEFETARVNHAKAETSLGQAKEKLAELHAELLNRSEVGSDFERRISECEIELNKAEKDNRKCTEHLSELNAEKNNTAKYAKRFETDMADYTPKLLETQQDINTIWDSIENCIENLKRAENKTKEYHRRELEPFRDTHTLFTGTLDGIISVIDNHNITGDKYFTLYERTEEDIKHYQNRIVQLSVLLRDVEDSRKQLVTNCIQRVGRLYENLSILSKKSTIQFGNVKRQMIRIDLPEIDKMSEQPAERINQYITGQVKKYLSEQENSIKSKRNHLEIRQLLNCYIGKESIPITVFKIDKSIQNSRYRSWQDAVKANSGGEQTVVLFSLLVSVMNYTRSLTSSLVHTSGVLILDNPFDRISSPHLLEPMFRIARHFNIQLICLTHIGTSAIINCFDMVYQLSFRNLPLSNVEVLKSELQQHMEHAYYFSEQLSLFNGTMSP